MKRNVALIIAAAAVLGLAPISAQAAPKWQTINQRQERMDDRIDKGVKSGELTKNEARRLRDEFRALARLEAQYRRSGGRFTENEKRDLDRRFDRLSMRIKAEKHDRQDR